MGSGAKPIIDTTRMTKDTEYPMSSTVSSTPVTIIGLGPMGRAMATTLLKAGHPVTVWSRTPARADEVVASGATRAATPAAAVAASDLVILSLTDYQAMYDILTPVEKDVLAGKTLVNLSSDTPTASRDAPVWAGQRGATFVTGGVMVPAPMVGTPDAFVFYSGPAAAVERYEPVLALLGRPRYLGADPGLAQLFYQAFLDVFLTTLSSLLHATALIAAGGARPADFLGDARAFIAGIPEMIEDETELARRFETGDHPGALSTATMMGATADHIVRTSEALGVDLELPKAVKAHYDQIRAAGRGAEGWTALYDVIKAR
jgi:3-hydroxyisobutyrate dehydrogenase and related beta-hydroxyacid dehydrogenases